MCRFVSKIIAKVFITHFLYYSNNGSYQSLLQCPVVQAYTFSKGAALPTIIIQGLFSDALQAASQSKEDGGLGIKSIFIEKDYWICRSLALMAVNGKDNRAIFKGGTSLTKAYGIGSRFSEDIDIAISEAWTLSGNQLKMLIKRTAISMTEGLQEMDMPGFTSKGSHYHKAYYSYPRAIDTLQIGAIRADQLLVEINSFANPYPFQKCKSQSFLIEFLQKTGNENLIEEYDMQPFEVNVLDRRRTLTEKLVSLLRCSLADNYIPELTAKIRHFYDLHFSLNDEETRIYLESDAFKADFVNLFAQDQQRFDKPEGWQDKDIMDSPIINDLHGVWSTLSNVYSRELPDLAYKEIPTVDSIENSMGQLFSYLAK